MAKPGPLAFAGDHWIRRQTRLLENLWDLHARRVQGRHAPVSGGIVSGPHCGCASCFLPGVGQTLGDSGDFTFQEVL